MRSPRAWSGQVGFEAASIPTLAAGVLVLKV
jgi:hypothetical protein